MKTLDRKQRALATRRRMVAAAYHLFCRHGYPATTMEAIAREAGVAVQTLYFTFHTKGAILGEVFGAAVMGLDDPVAPEAARWYAAFVKERDARRALAMVVENVARILGRVGPLQATLRAAANDPEVAAVHARAEERRLEGYRGMVRVLAGKRRLRLTRARAADVLFVMLGPELFHALVDGRGWPAAECRRWLADSLWQQLFS